MPNASVGNMIPGNCGIGNSVSWKIVVLAMISEMRKAESHDLGYFLDSIAGGQQLYLAIDPACLRYACGSQVWNSGMNQEINAFR